MCFSVLCPSFSCISKYLITPSFDFLSCRHLILPSLCPLHPPHLHLLILLTLSPIDVFSSPFTPPPFLPFSLKPLCCRLSLSSSTSARMLALARTTALILSSGQTPGTVLTSTAPPILYTKTTAITRLLALCPSLNCWVLQAVSVPLQPLQHLQGEVSGGPQHPILLAPTKLWKPCLS